MSRDKLQHEAERWLQTANEDLRAAQALRQEGLYAHACFIAQQCAEKALKAMWYAAGEEPWGHSIQKLVMQFPDPQAITELQAWTARAAVLDKFYIPTRYPNGLPDLTPGQSYFLHDADQAIEYATLFLQVSREFVESKASAK